MKKTFSVTLSGELLAYADRMVAESSAGSVEDLLISALEELKRDQDAAVRQFTEGSGLKELKRRLETPREEFVAWDGKAARSKLRRLYEDRLAGKQRAAE